jgi:hypothetical protein
MSTKSVDQPIVSPQLDRYACRQVAPRVFFPFVTEWVELGRHDECRSDATNVICPKWRCFWRESVGQRSVLIPEPHHGIACKPVSFCILAVRLSVEVAVHDRIHEELQREWQLLIAGAKRDTRGKVAAGAVTGDNQNVCAATKACGRLTQPLRRCPCIFEAGRERVFWRKAIVHGDYEHRSAFSECAAKTIMAVEAANDPTTPMEEGDSREITISVRTVNPEKNLPVWTLDRKIADRLDVVDCSKLRSRALVKKTPRDDWRQFTYGGRANPRQFAQVGGSVRVEWHVSSPLRSKGHC